ncbi:unnamed protein product [Strongylus vulgaris]|uniref:Ig-like domain-containing protein n=1 Tax=Strongylus vulgaris TaxID=40348 RepID=A0A3P7IWD9_STRVU|nr:unnamed protein product [Strongylus vulgaris]
MVNLQVHVLYEVRERGGTVVRNVPVDEHMTELTLSLSGDKDDEEVLDITLKDPSGRPVDKNVYSKEGGTIDLKNVKLIRLKDPQAGVWQVITNSRLKHTIRIFGHGTIDFKYGFATRPLERIELARPRPVSNQNTYLLVNMTGLVPPGTTTEISLLDYYGNTLMTDTAIWTLPEVTLRDRGEYFCVVISENGNHTVKTFLDTREIFNLPQLVVIVLESPPLITGLTNTSTPLGHPAFLHCQTQSSSKVEIRWLRYGVTVLNGVNTMVYPNGTLRIHQTSRADAGAYECQARNTGGMTSQSTLLKVCDIISHI